MTATAIVQAERVRQEMDLLGDVDREVRLRAAMELGRLRAGEAAPALVERLGLEPEFFIRETLTWAVLRIADDAMPYLVEAVASGAWLARLQAVHVLGKLGRHADADRLTPLVRDEVDAVAARAYWAALQTHNPSVVPALVSQLARGDSEHQNSLTVALVGFGETAVPALVDALRGGATADVRLHAADTLGLMGSLGADRAALPLAEALDDADDRVRLAALNAIGQLRLPFADLTVDRATWSDEPMLRHLAVRLAGRRPSSDAPRPADGIPTRGMVAAASGVLIELRCETDVVAKGRTFRDLGQLIADLAAARPQDDVGELLRVRLDDGTLADAVAALSSASGENVQVGRIAHLPGSTTVCLHTAAVGLPPRIGAMVAVDGGPAAEDVGRKVALQVAASAPLYLARGDIPVDVVAAVRTDAESLARTQGKPEALTQRLVAGRIEQLVHSTVLLEQVSVVDPGRTVQDLLFGTGVRITGFARLEVETGPR